MDANLYFVECFDTALTFQKRNRRILIFLTFVAQFYHNHLNHHLVLPEGEDLSHGVIIIILISIRCWQGSAGEARLAEDDLAPATPDYLSLWSLEGYTALVSDFSWYWYFSGKKYLSLWSLEGCTTGTRILVT